MTRTRLVIAGGAAAVGLSLGVAAVASAGTSQTTEDPAAETDDVQEPQLDGSIQAPESEGTSEDEDKDLESLATVTADEAIAAATAAVPGTADKAELGNENGTVVYEVDVTADDGTKTEIKVDAGNGAVLDSSADDQGDENEADEADEDEGSENEANEVEDD